MTIRQLEYFLSAARTLSFTKTAQAFYNSQSAITQQIKSLEEELDVKLFWRNNNQIRLTPVGELFVPEADAIVSRLREAQEKLHAARDGMTGSLSIGYLQSVEMTQFPGSIQEFSEDYPGIQMNLHRDNAMALHDDFMDGKYDLIFSIDNEVLQYPGAGRVELEQFPFYVVVRPNHPFARRRQVSQEDLLYEKLIVHESFRSLADSQHVRVEKYLTEENMKNITKTENEVETILIMVASGLGIAVLPEFDIRTPQISLNLRYIPLDTNGYQETLSIFYAKESDNPLVPLFLERIRIV